ncbi:hypothetical protein Ddye_021093 [Dipteronia dyeriana]|uniref:Uncharacterized protein n=1 Tax=Dipteronia dyeriana TaxID=168575 RepID=A0AAD9U1E9_9ROSI|nr:hypothetical protein Ddye_021093 [Dipteronia dyeriana]
MVDALTRTEAVQGYMGYLAAFKANFLDRLMQLATVDSSYIKLKQEVLCGLRNWVELIDVAQFYLNLHKSSSMGMSPVELCLKFQPLTLLEVAQQIDQRLCPTAYCFA